MASCNTTDAHQQWTFTGEDGGEPGTLQPASQPTLCLDPRKAPKITMTSCASGGNGLKWMFDSKKEVFYSAETIPCIVSKHGKTCHACLDVTRQGTVDIWDCWFDFEKSPNSNQKWSFDPSLGASSLGHGNRCLGAYTDVLKLW